jgi:hypothetical protein
MFLDDALAEKAIERFGPGPVELIGERAPRLEQIAAGVGEEGGDGIAEARGAKLGRVLDHDDEVRVVGQVGDGGRGGDGAIRVPCGLDG